MKFSSFIGFIAIIWAPSVFADNLSKIKLVDVKTHKLNEEYVNQATYKAYVVPVNETYSTIAMIYDVKKDFPLDTKLVAEVMRSDGECTKYEKIHEYSTPLCESTGEYFKYLPDLVIELNGQGICLSKGHYETNDHGIFKFYNLLSDNELKSPCLKAVITFTSGSGVLLYNFEATFVPK